VAGPGTALSPEWDRGFDEAFTELISGDPDLVRAEFDALISAGFDEPPPPPASPAPADARPLPHPPAPGRSTTPPEREAGRPRDPAGDKSRSPPDKGSADPRSLSTLRPRGRQRAAGPGPLWPQDTFRCVGARSLCRRQASANGGQPIGRVVEMRHVSRVGYLGESADRQRVLEADEGMIAACWSR